MKNKHNPSAFAHAVKMLWRNKGSYAMLTVTIVLSFSLFLGYLTFMDSNLYNKYKVIFSSRKDVVMAQSSDREPTDHLALAANARKVDENVQLYHYFEIQTQLRQYQRVNARVFFLPQGDRPVFNTALFFDGKDPYNITEQIKPIFGKADFNLAENEAIVNKSFFEAISPDGKLPVSIVVPVKWTDKTTSYFQVDVVGVTPDKEDCLISYNEKGEYHGQVEIYLSQLLLKGRTASEFSFPPRRITWICSEKPEEIVLQARQFDMVVHAVADEQEEALIRVQAQKATKGIVAIVLLFLLGINLYSSFSNALERRKYEIGVKRAIGASSGSIMRQFLGESLMVMLFNIVASIVIVVDVLICYKLYAQLIWKAVWTVNVSIHSIIMFLICSISLTVVFSLLFAYKSTKVEIVKYLKAE